MGSALSVTERNFKNAGQALTHQGSNPPRAPPHCTWAPRHDSGPQSPTTCLDLPDPAIQLRVSASPAFPQLHRAAPIQGPVHWLSPKWPFPASFTPLLKCHFLGETFSDHLKPQFLAVAGMAQCIERRPVKQRVTGSTPGQSTCLHCGPGPVGSYERQPHIDVSLPLFLTPFPCLKINKNILKNKTTIPHTSVLLPLPSLLYFSAYYLSGNILFLHI